MKKQRKITYNTLDMKVDEILAKIEEIIVILDRMIVAKRKFNAEMAEKFKKWDHEKRITRLEFPPTP